MEFRGPACCYGTVKRTLAAAALLALLAACGGGTQPTPEAPVVQKDPYKDKLSAEEYRVLRQKGTEAPFSGKYDTFFGDGVYSCGACGQDLFRSETKYDSSCGWPSYWDAIPGATKLQPDGGAPEVVCSKCGSHLGHLFDDGPKPTGKRY